MFRQEQCVRCFECFDDCKLGAISGSDGQPVVDLDVCRWCGDCADGCSTDARRQVGSVMTESRVHAEIAESGALYRQSGGGVTFTGGEPLLQAEFLFRLLEGCRALDIHSAVDTCGAAAPWAVERAAELADLILYDVKHVDDKAHRRMTGSSNREILENLRLLSRLGVAVKVRFPVIPGVNDDAPHVRRLAELVASLGFREIDVVPYRRVDASAYEALGRPHPLGAINEPSPEAIADAVRLMAECGVRATVVRRA
jgi:pyruvate formate lyase activating enzyme